MRFLFLAVWLSCQLPAFAQAPSPSPGPAQQITLDTQTRKEVIEAALKALNEKYVFPETAKKMEAAVRYSHTTRETSDSIRLSRPSNDLIRAKGEEK